MRKKSFSLGSKLYNQHSGSFGDIGTFSFHATKNLTTGEGGMVITNNKKFAEKIKLYRSHGVLKKRYFHLLHGHNFRLTNLQAAIGCAQFEKLDQIVKKKIFISNLYKKYLSNKNIMIIKDNKNIINSHWLFCFFLKNIQNYNEIEKILSMTDPKLVNLCADTGHLYFAGVDPIDFFQKHIDRMKHIHFKDIRHDVFNNINFKEESFLSLVLKGVFTVPGNGCIEFVKIAKTIKNSKYKGWIIVEAEQDPKIANPLDYAVLSKKYLDKIWSS